jgi:tRNA threonylcarbamoyladenosine biosynthesis protein TsaB
MIVLGIETSTEVCSVGLARSGQPPTEERVVEERIHSEKLLTLVRNLLMREHITTRELGAVAISIGPGSFTGLRIGLSTAKGLCFALNIPLVSVPTFDAIAQAVAGVHSDAGNILVALDAKKGDFYAGRYKKVTGSVIPVGRTKLSTEAEIKKEILESPPELLVTDNQLPDQLRFGGKKADIRDFCRGDSVARIGLAHATAGLFVDAESCEPTYLKDFVVIGKTSAV